MHCVIELSLEPQHVGSMSISQSTRNQGVLVVEGEFYIAEDLVIALLAEGLEVVGPAYSVSEALRQVRDGGCIRGAILDINLKDQLAYAVADELVSRGIPLVMTAGYFESPFDPAKVVAKLREKMALKQS
jgi:hypothetical protein